MEHKINFRKIGSSQMRAGCVLAGEMVMAPAVWRTFTTIKRVSTPMEGDANLAALAKGILTKGGMPPEIAQFARSIEKMPAIVAAKKAAIDATTPAVWAVKMEKAFSRPAFAALIANAISASHGRFWSADPLTALAFDDNERPPASDPIAIAITRAHRRMTGDPSDPRWVGLALFSIGRMIATNSSGHYNSHEWTETAITWFDLDNAFVLGDGRIVAQGVAKLDKWLQGQLSERLGSNMMTGLAEAAINATSCGFFNG